jgi:poly(beta-D-mannuronate) lyase
VGVAGGIIFFGGVLEYISNSVVIRLTILLVIAWDAQGKEWPVGSAKDIHGVLSKLKAGDAVVMQSGRWHDQVIRFNAKGTLHQPIILKAQKAGKTKLTGYSFLKIYGSHLVIDGLLFTDGYIDSSQSVIRLGEDTR